MNKTKLLTLILLLIVSTGFIFGSFGFSSVSAERDVSVQVVSDERAYVGYQTSDLTVRDGDTADLVTVKNQYRSTIHTTDTTIDDGSFTISNLTNPTNIPPGKEKVIRGSVECTPNATQEIELTITITGSDISAHIFGDTATREFYLTCEPEENSTSSRTHIQS